MNEPHRSSPAPVPPTLTLSAPVVAGDAKSRPALTFQWQNDRYRHQVELAGSCMASSIEGDSAESWPASAPVQQLSLETMQGQPTLLGVGAAGRSHWSVSVEAIEVDQVPAFLFQWACRLKQPTGKGSPMSAPIPPLGSEYRTDEQVRIVPLPRTRVENLGGNRIRLVPEACEASATVQWSYRIEVAPVAESA